MARRTKLDQQGIIEAFEQVIADVDARLVGGPSGTCHAELDAALARLRALGAAEVDLAHLARHAAWSACWSLLHRIEDEGAASDAFDGIHEVLPVDGDVLPPSPRDARDPVARLKRSHRAAFAPDALRLATADGRVHALAGGTSFRHKVPAHTAAVAWSPTGDLVVFGGPMGVTAYTPGAEAPLWSLKARYEDCDLEFSVDGALLVRRTSSAVQVLDPGTGTVLRTIDGDGRLLFGLHRAGDGTWRLHADHAPEHFVGVASADLSSVRWVASPASLIALRADGIGLGVSVGHRAVVAFDTTDGRELARWQTHDLVDHAAWSPDGTVLVIAHAWAFAFHDGGTFAHLGDLPRLDANHVAFSSDGTLVALSTWGAGEVWSVRAAVAAVTADHRAQL